MKKIDAIIKSFRLEAVKEALCGIGIEGLTVSTVWGFGRQMGRAEPSGGPAGAPSLMPKVRLEMVVRDDEVGPVLEVLARTANTGHLGDGKIFVAPILEAVRIRTSERGEAALRGAAPSPEGL